MEVRFDEKLSEKKLFSKNSFYFPKCRKKISVKVKFNKITRKKSYKWWLLRKKNYDKKS